MSIAQKVLADPGKYSIQQLKQAVQNGIIPAYIAVPIIQAKVQEQKQMQMAQSMQQPPAQQQAPVAERVMAEARGLEALPTNLPSQYAAGGIVAFDEGGDVKGYAQPPYLVESNDDKKDALLGAVAAGTPLVGVPAYSAIMPLIEALEPSFRPGTTLGQALGRTAAATGVTGAVPVGGGLASIKAARGMAAMTPEQRRAFYSNPMVGAMSPDSALAGAIMNAGQGPDQTGKGTSYFGQLGKLGKALAFDLPASVFSNLVSAPGSSSPFAPGASSESVTPTSTTATPPAAAPAPAPAAPPSTGTGLGGASALGRQPGVGLKMPEKPPEFTRPAGKSYEASAMEYYDTYGEKAEALDKQTDEAIKQANESVKGKAFEGYKKALEKEALQAGADKEQAKYMSLFKAGLAMMAGTSRHAFENIGKGAMVGAEDYQAAVKDLKKAEKERQKEFALIEQAQRAEAIGDRDTAIRRLDSARDRQDARLRYTGEGIYKATNLDKQQAYDIAKTQFSSSSDIFRTHLAGQYQMGAAGVSADARIAALLATAGSRGQMNQKQVGDTLFQLYQSPEANEYKKKLLKEKGERAANTPEFKAAMDKFVGGLFQKYYGGTTRGGGLLSGGLNLSDEDMQLIRRNLATGG